MSRNVLELAYYSLFPEGAIWIPEIDEDLSLYIEAFSENIETIRLYLEGLAFLRNPLLTALLDDLEKELGLSSITNLTEQERRQRLLASKTDSESNGSKDFLENKLQESGFDVQVHVNDPSVDPNLFLNSDFQMVCGQDTAVCGNENAFCGRVGGELLVNGKVYVTTRQYSSQCGESTMVCGNENAVCGVFENVEDSLQLFTVPTDPGYWHLIFFVGGDATRDPITGELTEIKNADIPASRRAEFETLILKYKPVHSWAGMLINYTE